jgi:enterochelin esterase-like enzyme
MAANSTDRWQTVSITSEALRGNPLRDPHERRLRVWAPADQSRSYPSVYVLQAMRATLDGWFEPEPGKTSYPELIDALAPDAVVVLVDAATLLGGSQYVDSPAIGNYHTYLCDEIVPFVDARFPTLADARHRGLQGKSSGGLGAMITPLLRPDLFGGLATHAGDALFDVTLAREFAPTARVLRELYDGSYERFWEDFLSEGRVVESDADHLLTTIWAMSAAFSPDADGSVELPFDEHTGELIGEVWERWLEFDPVLLARQPQHAETLRNMRAIWIDAGTRDEFLLDLGATAFHEEVVAAGTPAENVHFELFSGGHRGLTWRYPLSLAFLVERLSSTLELGSPKPSLR